MKKISKATGYLLLFLVIFCFILVLKVAVDDQSGPAKAFREAKYYVGTWEIKSVSENIWIDMKALRLIKKLKLSADGKYYTCDIKEMKGAETGVDKTINLEKADRTKSLKVTSPVKYSYFLEEWESVVREAKKGDKIEISRKPYDGESRDFEAYLVPRLIKTQVKTGEAQ